MDAQSQSTGFTLPELGYAFDALEPHIDARTMEIHHGKHHAAYVSKLNAALEGLPEFLSMPINELLAKANLDKLPAGKRQAVINNGGGHSNHTLFWDIMRPGGATAPEGELASAINSAFGSFDGFKEQFGNAAATRFGSGWAWMGFDGTGKLHVGSTANQDSPFTHGHVPILGLDVWEHAYYLNYQNRRPDYIAAWWNTVNWTRVSELFNAAK